jgi:dUTP pyrophosphatase
MNVKLFANGTIPTRAHHDDAGLDCYSRVAVVIHPGQTLAVPLGFGVELPTGLELQVRGRSSLAAKGIWCHLGTVDSGYRGEISAILHNLTPSRYYISAGQRIAQAVIASYRVLPLTPTLTLSPSIRGSNGFGSTGV